MRQQSAGRKIGLINIINGNLEIDWMDHVHVSRAQKWQIFKKDEIKFLMLADKDVICNQEVNKCLAALGDGTTFLRSGDLQI